MTDPIKMEELLDRVSGNREFVIQMLKMFFQSSDERLSALIKEFEKRDYPELSEQIHKLKGLVCNLSINKAPKILRDLHEATAQENDLQILRLLSDLEETISEAKTYYQNKLSTSAG